MTKIEITDSDRNLIQICLEIGRARFTDYTTTLAAKAAIDQFEKQANDAKRLMGLLAIADRITVETDAAINAA